MSNLNIQQKVSLITQKNKETKVKDANLSEEQLRINEYNEVIKPNLTEEQTQLIQKYITKLSEIGEYKEINIYDMMKKYDWNVVVLDDLTSVMIKKWRDSMNTQGWKQVAAPKKAKEAEDVKRPRNKEGEEINFRDKSRNFKGEQLPFKEKARRGQSVDNNQRGYRRDYDDGYDNQDAEEDFSRRQRRDQLTGRGQKVITVYVKKGEQPQGPFLTKKHISEEYTRKGRFEKIIYVKKDAGQKVEETEETKQDNKPSRGRDTRAQKIKDEPHLEVEREERKPRQGRRRDREGEDQNERGIAPGKTDEKTENKKNQTAQKAPEQTTSSPIKHFNEHNIQEFFKMTDLRGSEKKEIPKEPELAEEVVQSKLKEEKISPVALRVESDNTSQTAQKPLVEIATPAIEKPQQKEAHDQPIGSNRQNSHTATTTTQVATATSHTHPAHTPSQNVTSPITTQGVSTTTTPGTHPHSDNPSNDAKQPYNTSQYMSSPYGFAQYPQQPYIMPQYPQMPMFNPYMSFMPSQTHTAGKEHQQASYPPGFNPQDMSAMYQVPYILIPQPNGPPIIQPMYQMMPQMMGLGAAGPTGGDQQQQQKYGHPYYQYPMNMPNTPAEYFNATDDKKTRHTSYDNKTSTSSSTGPFFNFSTNESDYKKNQGSNVPQQGSGYTYMPYILPPSTQGGVFPSQQQGKPSEGSGNNPFKM